MVVLVPPSKIHHFAFIWKPHVDLHFFAVLQEMMQSLLGIYCFVGFTGRCQEISVYFMSKVTIPARNIAGKGKQRLLMKFQTEVLQVHII